LRSGRRADHIRSQNISKHVARTFLIRVAELASSTTRPWEQFHSQPWRPSPASPPSPPSPPRPRNPGNSGTPLLPAATRRAPRRNQLSPARLRPEKRCPRPYSDLVARFDSMLTRPRLNGKSTPPPFACPPVNPLTRSSAHCVQLPRIGAAGPPPSVSEKTATRPRKSVVGWRHENLNPHTAATPRPRRRVSDQPLPVHG